MRRAMLGALLLWAAGCANDGFGRGSCGGAGGLGKCASGEYALCRVPSCDGDGWIDYDTTGVQCRRTDDGRGQPYCDREADEVCWSEAELVALCAGDGG